MAIDFISLPNLNLAWKNEANHEAMQLVSCKASTLAKSVI
jgi:hypothetical protein